MPFFSVLKRTEPKMIFCSKYHVNFKKGLKKNYHWLISAIKVIVLENKTGHKYSVVIKLQNQVYMTNNMMLWNSKSTLYLVPSTQVICSLEQMRLSVEKIHWDDLNC